MHHLWDSAIPSASPCCHSQLQLTLSSLSLETPSLRSSSIDTLQTPLYETCLIATLICFICYFQRLLSYISLRSALDSRLIGTILAIETSACTVPDEGQKMLLWALWVAGMTFEQGEWYESRILQCLRHLKLSTFEQVEMCLKGFIWTQRMNDQRCVGFWERIQPHLCNNARDSNAK